MNINGSTKVYGIIGNPVHHSLSPIMHNAAFAELGENRVYLPFPVEDIAAAIQGIRALHIDGVSVTIPHKMAVLPHLDTIDPVAAKIGAVNTIRSRYHQGEAELCGHNTDWQGAVRPLRSHMNLAGKKVILLGAGGAARAIGFGLLEQGALVVVCSRTESNGRALAADLGCSWCALREVDALQGDILVNATSVGMAPLPDASPVPPVILQNYKIVMDIVYAPLTTRLLFDAQQAGCRTINGLEMLLYQGVAQFELWTGLQAPVEVMRRSLLKAVSPGSSEG
ncbi:MAG: shikimate dehydrogenase [Desulfopila sp.]|jgi:shikimate dehydrogenase|nr:shikimate dehydrogenase [Desulfopila sp.]